MVIRVEYGTDSNGEEQQNDYTLRLLTCKVYLDLLSRFLYFTCHDSTIAWLQISLLRIPSAEYFPDFFPLVPGKLHCSQLNKIDIDL